METFSAEFFGALLSIILINIVLSGDNAVVIALASRKLPEHQQKKAVFWGSFAAIALRVILTTVAVFLLQLPYVQVIGGLLLLPIAVKLLISEENEDGHKEADSLREAIQTIVIADFLMSLDNVLAVAGVAKGNLILIIIGLAISIPLIIFGSQLVMYLMQKYKWIVYLGAGLLGYTAGEMIVADRQISNYLHGSLSYLHWLIPALLAVGVVGLGLLLNKQRNPGEHSI